MSSCDCDCEMPSCYTEKWRIARKEHTCCECFSIIDIGEKYYYFSGIWSGKPESYKICEFCTEKRDEIENYTDCCIAFGDLWDFYQILEYS